MTFLLVHARVSESSSFAFAQIPPPLAVYVPTSTLSAIRTKLADLLPAIFTNKFLGQFFCAKKGGNQRGRRKHTTLPPPLSDLYLSFVQNFSWTRHISLQDDNATQPPQLSVPAREVAPRSCLRTLSSPPVAPVTSSLSKPNHNCSRVAREASV